MFKQPLLVLVNMSVPYFLPMLLQLAATETRCYLESQEKLMCKFPQDVNKTHLDFAVYFYSKNGGEEKLVDCGWIDLNFHCIRQEGFECQTPVSDTVVVSMPSSFADKKGSYKCIPHGDGHDTARQCRYPMAEDEGKFAACEANTALHSLSVAVICTFSFQVDSFKVLRNNNAVAEYTKSSCHHSCHYMPSNNTDVFSISLNVSTHPNDEFICLPSAPFISIKTCNITTTLQGSHACAVVVSLPVVVSLALLSTIIYFGPHFY
ncbi:uncharacterized protein LOC112568399 isoform X2 [Pomacea canaliculata]|nr:uncharacterized protein LOC112568399 isoform X2 [Pomacea canaliculata]XP_025101485.1 uncharacterized protein LOC112568399 isoform X2 [Pomacea canaliculata]